MVGWLVGFGFNSPLRQYFSLYRAVSQREGERGESIDESKNVQTTPTRTYCKRNRPLPYCYQNCTTPRHWKFTQHHRTTRPPPAKCESIDRETVRMISDGLIDAFLDKEQRVVIDLNPNCYFFTKFIGIVSGIRDIKNQIYARRNRRKFRTSDDS